MLFSHYRRRFLYVGLSTPDAHPLPAQAAQGMGSPGVLQRSSCCHDVCVQTRSSLPKTLLQCGSRQAPLGDSRKKRYYNISPLKLRKNWACPERALLLSNLGSLIYRATFISIALLLVAIYNIGKHFFVPNAREKFSWAAQPIAQGLLCVPFGEAVGL